MSRVFAIIENGVVSNVILAEAWPDGIDITDVVPRPGPGWSYDGQTFTPPPTSPPAPVSRHITRLAFRQRFTQAELVTIEIACLDDPSAPIQQRQQAAALRVMQRQVSEAAYIDLDRPDTRAGVQQLEAAGLIGPGRAAQILDAPIQPHEVWQP